MLSRIDNLRTWLGAMAVLVFFSGVDSYLYAITKDTTHPIYALYWVMAFFLLTLPLFVSDIARRLVSLPGVHGTALLLVLFATIAWLGTPGSIVSDQVYDSYVLSAAFMVMLAIVFATPYALEAGERAMVVAVLAGVVFNILDIIFIGIFTKSFPRAAGLYIDSNGSAAALTLGTIITLDAVPPKWRAAYLGCAVTGVLLSASRSGIAAFSLSIAILLFARTIRLRELGSSLGIVFVMLALLHLVSPPAMQGWRWGLWKRIESLQAAISPSFEPATPSPSFEPATPSPSSEPATPSPSFEPATPSPSLMSESVFERLRLQMENLQHIIISPWTGYGLGSDWIDSYYNIATPAAGSHNAYITLTAHLGLPSLSVLVLMFILSINGAWPEGRPIGWAYVAAAIFFGFFDNNIVDSRPKLVVWVLQCAAVAGMRSSRPGLLPVRRENIGKAGTSNSSIPVSGASRSQIPWRDLYTRLQQHATFMVVLVVMGAGIGLSVSRVVRPLWEASALIAFPSTGILPFPVLYLNTKLVYGGSIIWLNKLYCSGATNDDENGNLKRKGLVVYILPEKAVHEWGRYAPSIQVVTIESWRHVLITALGDSMAEAKRCLAYFLTRIKPAYANGILRATLDGRTGASFPAGSDQDIGSGIFLAPGRIFVCIATNSYLQDIDGRYGVAQLFRSIVGVGQSRESQRHQIEGIVKVIKWTPAGSVPIVKALFIPNKPVAAPVCGSVMLGMIGGIVVGILVIYLRIAKMQ